MLWKTFAYGAVFGVLRSLDCYLALARSEGATAGYEAQVSNLRSNIIYKASNHNVIILYLEMKKKGSPNNVSYFL